MTYLELREAVESAIARSDVPTYVYTLATKEINARFRIREMEITVALPVTSGEIYVDLGVGFRHMRHAYIGSDGVEESDGGFSDGFSDGFEVVVAGTADVFQKLEQTSDFVISHEFCATGTPKKFSIITNPSGEARMRLNPVPDDDYTVVVVYLTKMDDFVSDSDTNQMIGRFPGLYIYSALKHAAIWAQDIEMASTYAAAYEGEATRVIKQDRVSRYSGPLVSVRG